MTNPSAELAHCCVIGCPQPAAVEVHEASPGASPHEYSHACADHVREIEQTFTRPETERL